jgi:hypothetical protein
VLLSLHINKHELNIKLNIIVIVICGGGGGSGGDAVVLLICHKSSICVSVFDVE